MPARRSRPVLVIVTVLTVAPGLGAQEGTAGGAPEQAASLAEALKKGQAEIHLRYRYENVRDDAFEKEARASTLRTALGYKTLPYKGWSLFVEAENVAEVGNDLYRNPNIQVPQYSSAGHP